MSSYIGEPSGPGSRGQVYTAVGFLILAVVALYLPEGAQQPIGNALQGTVLRPFVMTNQLVAAVSERSRDYERLRSQMDSVVAVLSNQTTLAEENRRLRSLLQLSERTGPSYAAATVTRPGTPGSESMFVVDLGYEDGVRPNSTVMADDGLLGVIREVGPRTSVGIDWSHPDFRASAMTSDGLAFGLVEPRRGLFRQQDRLVLNGVAFLAEVDSSALVVTSGRGGVYPRGIPVGEVTGVAEEEAGWARSYFVRPAVTPGAVTHALVHVQTRNGVPSAVDSLIPGSVGDRGGGP